MAKKNKTRKGNNKTTTATPKLVISGEFTTKAVAPVDELAARYYPLARALREDRDLGEGWVLQMDADGYICDDSWLDLRDKAEKLLGAVAWPSKEGINGQGVALWLNGFADKDHTFKVSVSRSRKPHEDRMRKGMETLLITDMPQGMPPQTGDKDGIYAEVPGLGVLLSRDLVEVRYGKEVIERTSFMTALERQRVDYWGVEAKRIAKAQAEAEAKAQAQAQAKVAARKALLMRAFMPVLEEREDKREEERWSEASRDEAVYQVVDEVLSALRLRVVDEGDDYPAAFLALCRRDNSITPDQVSLVLDRADDRIESLLDVVAGAEGEGLDEVASEVAMTLTWSRPAALSQTGEIMVVPQTAELLSWGYVDVIEWVATANLYDDERKTAEDAIKEAMDKVGG